MLDIQQKRRFRNFIYNKFTLSVLFVIVLLALHSTWKVYQKRKESFAMMSASMVRLNELEQRDRELELKIKKLSTESGLEEEIRSKFNVAKDSENIVIIVREEDSGTTTEVTKPSLWSKFKGLFR